MRFFQAELTKCQITPAGATCNPGLSCKNIEVICMIECQLWILSTAPQDSLSPTPVSRQRRIIPFQKPFIFYTAGKWTLFIAEFVSLFRDTLRNSEGHQVLPTGLLRSGNFQTISNCNGFVATHTCKSKHAHRIYKHFQMFEALFANSLNFWKFYFYFHCKCN